MTRSTFIRGVAIAATAYAVACGGGDGIDPPRCELSLVVTPSQPVRGDTVELAVDVFVVELSGIEEFEWSVQYGGAPVAFDVGGEEITFVANQAGVYDILVTGSVGGTACTSASRDLNVIEEGAIFESMRLVIVPRDRALVPAQTIDFQLPGGADYTLSTLTLEGGEAAGGTLRGPDSEPLPAYLRVTPDGADQALWYEGFSEADGGYALKLLAVNHDVLIVPEADLAPLLLTTATAADLDGSLVVPTGITVSGTVLDGTGDPVAGARVQVTVAGAPSTIGVTGAGGAFSLQARAGGPIAVSVVPDEASGLPALEVMDGLSIADGAVVDVQYDAGLDLRTVSPVLRQTDGTTPAAQARVTFIARSIAGAGSIAVDGTPLAADGLLTRSAQANGSGVIPSQLLTAANYDVIVEPGPGAPASQGVRFAPVDLRTGQTPPAELNLAAPAEFTGQVLDVDGAPVEGARIIASPNGLLARATRAGGTATTAANGTFTLEVAGRGDYSLRIDGPVGAGRIYRRQTAPAPGAATPLAEIDVPGTLRLGGALGVVGGIDITGALVQLQCLTCGPGGVPATVAEAVTDASGGFVLLAPDPGVAE